MVSIERIVLTFLFLFFAFSFCNHTLQKDDKIRLMLKFRISSFDPVESNDETSEFVLGLLHRRLFQMTSSGTIELDLAKSYRETNDALFIELKQGVTFLNGTPLTARDVQFSLERLRKSALQNWVLDDIESVETVAPDTIRLKYRTKAQYVNTSVLKAKLALPRCGIYSKKDFTGKKTFSGLGFYRIQSSNSSSVQLAARPEYPKLKSIQLNVYPDEASRYFSFSRKMLSIYEATGIFRFMPYDKVNYWEFVLYNSAVAYGAVLPAPNSRLNDPLVRRYVNALFPRDALCKNTLLNACVASTAAVPAIYAPAPENTIFNMNNPEYRNLKIVPEKVIIYTPPDRERQNIAVVLAGTLKSIGFIPQIKTVDLPTMLRLNNQKTAGIYLLKWMADYPHAENFLKPLFHSQSSGPGGNRSWFQNKEMDHLIETMDNDPVKITKIQKKIQEHSPWIFIGFWANHYRIDRAIFENFPRNFNLFGSHLLTEKAAPSN